MIDDALVPDEARIYGWIEEVFRQGVRRPGYPADRWAETWLQEQFRAFGLEGIQARLRQHCALAERFATWVHAEPGWELLAPVTMSVACFRHRPSAHEDEAALEARNARILERVNADKRLKGWWQFLRREQGWGAMTRKGFGGTTA